MSFANELTVCICTRDRPRDLERAIASVADHAPTARVVVSDDGGGSALPVCEGHAQVRWVPGPERGLGANRNAAVAAAETSWVVFLDDDARLGEGFVAAIDDCLMGIDPAERERTVITGRERKGDLLVEPNDVDFLGFQRRPYEPGEPLHTVVINATVWPRRLFEEVDFDERLLYGSDEVDLCCSALGAGYRIVPCPSAVNPHDPAPSGRDGYALNASVSRLRVGMKRNRARSPWRAALFALIAPLHLLLSELRSEGLRGVRRCTTILGRWLLGTSGPLPGGGGAGR
ncbi:MAG TPA: glycosyltransferase [Solirubrobacterales bacterium]|nr:glycosyltransferase [Solirubrobacterales bacterium]